LNQDCEVYYLFYHAEEALSPRTILQEECQKKFTSKRPALIKTIERDSQCELCVKIIIAVYRYFMSQVPYGLKVNWPRFHII